MDPWQAQALVDKEYSGYSPAQTPTQSVNLSQVEPFPKVSRMPLGRKKKGTPQALSTGNFAWRSPRRSLYQQLLACLDEESMPSSQDPKLPSPTATSQSQDLPSLSNLELNPFVETQEQTGKPYGPPPSPEIWNPSQPMSVWFLTGLSGPSPRTSPLVEECYEQFSCFGVLRAVANLTVHGMKQELTLILSVQDPSSGMGTRINNMLWSMNFEEVLIRINHRSRCCAPATMDGSLPCTCRDQGLFKTIACYQNLDHFQSRSKILVP